MLYLDPINYQRIVLGDNHYRADVLACKRILLEHYNYDKNLKDSDYYCHMMLKAREIITKIANEWTETRPCEYKYSNGILSMQPAGSDSSVSFNLVESELLYGLFSVIDEPFGKEESLNIKELLYMYADILSIPFTTQLTDEDYKQAIDVLVEHHEEFLIYHNHKLVNATGKEIVLNQDANKNLALILIAMNRPTFSTVGLPNKEMIDELIKVREDLFAKTVGKPNPTYNEVPYQTFYSFEMKQAIDKYLHDNEIEFISLNDNICVNHTIYAYNYQHKEVEIPTIIKTYLLTVLTSEYKHIDEAHQKIDLETLNDLLLLYKKRCIQALKYIEAMIKSHYFVKEVILCRGKISKQFTFLHYKDSIYQQEELTPMVGLALWYVVEEYNYKLGYDYPSKTFTANTDILLECIYTTINKCAY